MMMMVMLDDLTIQCQWSLLKGFHTACSHLCLQKTGAYQTMKDAQAEKARRSYIVINFYRPSFMMVCIMYIWPMRLIKLGL